jgi:N-acetyl-alpha-D-glucosaminyl L-malate synthase BshA
MAQKILEKNQGRTIPFITTLHGTDITLVGRDKTYEPVVTFSINESDAITAVSENLREETLRSFNITKPIHVIHNFVDVRRFQRKPIDAFRRVIAPQGEKILLHASNFRKIKRVEDVVRTFAEVRRVLPAKLLMVGDGPERHMAESMCRETGYCDDIRFVGKQEQMEDIMVISDLFLLPSEYESFGLSALEAMAAGVPVISSDAGGLPEIVIQGVNGFMSRVGDVESMARHAIQLLKDEAMYKEFSAAARNQAKKFDIQNTVPLYEDLYKQFVPQAVI